MSLYRARWQVEFVFTRLKSIIGVGHLPKHDPDSCLAWLYGKMVVALLVERLYREAEFFSPGGIECLSPQHALEKPPPTQPVRSPWREFEFWFMVVRQAIVPRLSIDQAIEHWEPIKKISLRILEDDNFKPINYAIFYRILMLALMGAAPDWCE